MKNRIVQSLLPCLFVAIAFFGGVQVARAFTTFDNDAFWPNANPHYTIDESYDSQGPNWTAVANDATADWNSISVSPLRFFSSGGAGDNHVTAGPLACQTPRLLAITDIGFQGNTITDFQIIVNVVCGYPFYDGSQSPTLPVNYFNLQSVVEHEFGHGLGLCHSETSGVLMHASLAKGVNQTRKKDDNKGNRYLYQATYTGTGPTSRCPQ